MVGDRALEALGIDAARFGIADHYLPDEVNGDFQEVPGDTTASLSRLESIFYQGNMLLRDGDANSMKHGLEIRVPMLDRRMLDLAHSLPGRLRLPLPIANKHLLRVAFAPHLRPALLNQGKRGFSLPLRRWMLGPMRDLCEYAIAQLKVSGLLRSEGIDAVWRSYLADPESQAWSRALVLCTLGMYLRCVTTPQQPPQLHTLEVPASAP
jgi:asparagine synthase (glutamine-hydrolysing)